MTAIEIHRLAMDTQDHIERLADMWFGYLKFATPVLIAYCLGWFGNELSHSRFVNR